ncbi:ribonuclease BN (tRNA processing enzyme) [Desulfobaculum xiamenense]|uniref:Ribonuclease BN (tRNA processing enzyme) n=1 Tax=Desulfobaculum xiamenense TaxID=995050 RepID=A0A846QUC0_9BACT|nr:ribonuclease Z [Desulfobaculum xiamenense]NJB68239.1 ribonuclease BN (tRNA processing enzyme) [Desulfobaculum xiamenense]
MLVTFTGVGEAFDERIPNCSILLEANGANGPVTALLDCGFTAAHAFWRTARAPLDLDCLWISHFHGDHFFGVPLLYLRFWEEDRTRPLTVIGGPGVEAALTQAMDAAYPRFRERMRFPVHYIEAEPGRPFTACGLNWNTAFGGHGQPCLAVRVDDGERAVFYSGDGRPTPETLALATGCDLVAQEAFSLELDTEGHGTIPGAIDFARKAEAKRLAIVHVNRRVRHGRTDEIRALLATATDINACMPEAGDSLRLG